MAVACKFDLFLSFLVISVFLAIFANVCLAAEDSLVVRDITIIKNDYKNFYLNKSNLIKLGIGISGAGIFANTSMDGDIQQFYQDNIRGETTDGMSKVLKVPGNMFITIPILFGTRIFLEKAQAGEWAQGSLRAIVVGVPAGLVTQRVTGASRPAEDDSKWKPFKDDNGLSGYSFIGAVPFITAAKMNKNSYIKGLLYGLSILPGLSRINDNKHYFSQVALGWYLAFLSCDAVAKTDSKNKTIFITPFLGKGMGIFISKSF